jgi:hypothetical protein
LNFIKLIILSVLFTSNAAFARTDLLDVAIQTKNNITKRLAACGSIKLDPDDPRLPRRLVLAHEAYANFDAGFFPGYYYRQTFGNSQNFEYKRRNGGTVAWMNLNFDNSLSFGTSRGGIRARMNRYLVPGGERFNFWCNSQRVNEQYFRNCVEQTFIRPLLAGFCAR